MEVFFFYALKDEKMVKSLKTHLGLSMRQDFFTALHNCPISLQVGLSPETDGHLRRAQGIIVLGIGPSFLDSDSGVHISNVAMERHNQRIAIVIPVLLTPCEYRRMPFAKLQCLPKGNKAMTKWRHRDEVCDHIAEGIRNVAEQGLYSYWHNNTVEGQYS